MKKNALILFAIFIPVYAVCGTITFDEAVNNMLTNSPCIKIAYLNYAASLNAVKKSAGLLYDTRFNATGDFNGSYELNGINYDNAYYSTGLSQSLPSGGTIFAGYNSFQYQFSGSGPYENYNPSFNLMIEQPLLRGLFGFPADNPIKKAEIAGELKKAMLKANIITGISKLKECMMKIFSAQENLEINIKTVNAANLVYQEDKNSGATTQQLYLIKSFILSKSAETVGFQNAVTTANEYFLSSAGYGSDDWDNITVDALTVTTGSYVPQTLTAELEDTLTEVQPEVTMAEENSNSASISMDEAQWKLLPDLDLNASAGVSGNDTEINKAYTDLFRLDDRNYSFGLNFSFDIPDSMETFDYKWWKDLYSEDIQEVILAKNSARLNIRFAWRNLMQAEDTYNMRKEAALYLLKRLEMMKNINATTTVNAREMILTINDYTKAANNEVAAKADYINDRNIWNRLSGKYDEYFHDYLKNK